MVVTNLSASEASRFLAQAGLAATAQDIAAVQQIGPAAWLEQQFAAGSDQSHWDWLIAKGFNGATHVNSSNGIDASLYRKLMSSPDQLRQRIALAYSEIFVVSLTGLTGQWRAFAGAGYMDLLSSHAFGNFRSLLEAVTLSPAMGVYLGTRNNQKENPQTGRQADENYAREIMQLFTIGLYQLNLDGTQKLDAGGKPVETYSLENVTHLARVFTGWEFNKPVSGLPDHWQRPMVMNPSRHSTSAKNFLGVSLPAGGDGVAELKVALDTLFLHPNVAPFFARQMIMRLVTSNPGPAYVRRVAQVFINNGKGVRGDLKAVVRAVLLDTEARQVSRNNPIAGKLREPVLRLVQWARTFRASSTSGNWNLGRTDDPDRRLGQSPLRSPSVFNFFRPGFVPPGNALGAPNRVAPELQITTESTVIGYANFMQNVINGSFSDLKPDYSAQLAQAGDVPGLLAHLNLVLAAGQISAANLNGMAAALNTINGSTDTGKQNRVKAAIMLIMCAPEYLVLK